MVLRDLLEKLKQQRVDKENKLADNSLSFPELRDKLLNRVKNVKGNIQNLEKNLKEKRRIEDNIRKTEQRLKNRLAGKSSLSEEQKRKVKKIKKIIKSTLYYIQKKKKLKNF